MKTRKVAIITGASKGLGKALTLAFAKKGFDLGICSREKSGLEKVLKQAESLGANVVSVQADASKPADVDRFISVIESSFGRIDVVINNASTFGPGPTLLGDYPSDQFEEVIRKNTSIPFLVTKRALPGMLVRQKGSIINVTSEVGKVGIEGWGAYSVSKFGVEGLTAIWADELKDTGVTINLVDPGEMNTRMHDIAIPDCDYELAVPEDVVDAFLYLASSEAEHINGQRFEAQSFEKGGSRK
ncbi:SDR family NAD(P)-dependent oxidoreductase [Halobacillus sp. BBL2006]|uniref:SDR family NAD(P)-dependent oxidoreductase n=1 Tax=Halobacillus sp. BBL2006 TaxID=1543706 RepID=UPI000542E825|nr:SDR family oxidoreductase [Halobacillus sp. BBL2006]KHE69862.1 3-oxoacyl-ACP reductase [Halobacillus sp. BBL2006]